MLRLLSDCSLDSFLAQHSGLSFGRLLFLLCFVLLHEDVQDIVFITQDLTVEWQSCRKTGRHVEGATIVSGSALGFLWRIITRAAGYVARIRRFFAFKLARGGAGVEVKEGGGILERKNKVEEGLVESSGASCEPELAEIIVTSPKETIDHGLHDVDSKVDVLEDDCGSKLMQINLDVEQSGTCGDENHEACLIEHTTSATEQSTSNPCFPQEPTSVTCEPVNALPQELDDVTAEAQQNQCHTQTQQIQCHTQAQHASQEQELVDVPIRDKCIVLQVAPSSDSNHTDNLRENPEACLIEHTTSATEQFTSNPCFPQGPTSVTCEPVNALPQELDNITAEAQQNQCHTQAQHASQEQELVDVPNRDECIVLQAAPGSDSNHTDNLPKEDSSSVELSSSSLSGSKKLSKTLSIQQLNSIVAEQLRKYIRVLERNIMFVPGKAEHAIWSHRRAIIVATLVAIAVWARNSRHLHESMPRIKCSAINVHIRSRL